MAVRELTINSDQSLYDALNQMQEDYREHRYLIVEYNTGKTRTSLQNRALHKWLEMVAQCLNDAGMEMVVNVPDKTRKPWHVPWNKHSVKENIWKPIQEAMTGKESTAEAERPDYAQIEQVIHRRFAQSMGIDLPPWPQRVEPDGK